MESTGVYWIPVYEILASRGFEVFLVNARHVKNVPGRNKTDVVDCQWIQQLHTYGFLSASFHPEEDFRVLRSYMRQRENLINYSSQHIQHMQKALFEMNLQLPNVVSDITGVTGLKIIRDIVSGIQSPEMLAKHRDRRCKKSEEVIAKSLHGHYRDEHVFALKQALELYDTFREKIAACDKEVEKIITDIALKTESSYTEEKKRKKPRKYKNSMSFSVESFLKQITGIDLTKINGLDGHSTLKLISEIGLDMTKWPTAKHFGSWLGLAPGSKISGGKVLSSKTKKSNNRAANILRIAASTLHSSKSALGAYLRRQKSRLGSPKAITATAYKIARLVYTMLKNRCEFTDTGQDYYEKQYKDRVLKNFKRKAKDLGFNIIPINNELGEVP